MRQPITVVKIVFEATVASAALACRCSGWKQCLRPGPSPVGRAAGQQGSRAATAHNQSALPAFIIWSFVYHGGLVCLLRLHGQGPYSDRTGSDRIDGMGNNGKRGPKPS